MRVCSKCRELIPSPLDAFERRLEFRRPYDQRRQATATTGLVCRDCMTEEIDRLRRPHVQQQGRLDLEETAT